MLGVIVHGAGVQDRDGAVDLLKPLRRLFPWIEVLWADAGDRGPKLAAAVSGMAAGAWRSSSAHPAGAGSRSSRAGG